MVITSCTRNAVVLLEGHVGSNPILSVKKRILFAGFFFYAVFPFHRSAVIIFRRCYPFVSVFPIDIVYVTVTSCPSAILYVVTTVTERILI